MILFAKCEEHLHGTGRIPTGEVESKAPSISIRGWSNDTSRNGGPTSYACRRPYSRVQTTVYCPTFDGGGKTLQVCIGVTGRLCVVMLAWKEVLFDMITEWEG